MADAKAESLRKMFLAMVDDVRVVIIKLADRLHNMRTLGGQPKHKRKRIARETLDIFAPLANRLGIWQIKWELEDLSFRYVQPETYRELATGHAAEAQRTREAGGHVQARVWKMRWPRPASTARSAAAPNTSTASGARCSARMSISTRSTTSTVSASSSRPKSQCYAALGVVHSLWRPIPGEFDDYIANPKDNLYRSLHTAVFGKNGRPIEVQIRTAEMNELAELGIAAHWKYKEGRAATTRTSTRRSLAAPDHGMASGGNRSPTSSSTA